MRWRSGLAFVCKEVMIGLLLENEAGCLIRQHTEPRGGPPTNRTRWPEPSTARAVSFSGHKRPIVKSIPTAEVRFIAAARPRGQASFFVNCASYCSKGRN